MERVRHTEEETSAWISRLDGVRQLTQSQAWLTFCIQRCKSGWWTRIMKYNESIREHGETKKKKWYRIWGEKDRGKAWSREIVR